MKCRSVSGSCKLRDQPLQTARRGPPYFRSLPERPYSLYAEASACGAEGVGEGEARGPDQPRAPRRESLRDGLPVPAEAIARAVRFAIKQPRDADVNEIVVRPTVTTA